MAHGFFGFPENWDSRIAFSLLRNCVVNFIVIHRHVSVVTCCGLACGGPHSRDIFWAGISCGTGILSLRSYLPTRTAVLTNGPGRGAADPERRKSQNFVQITFRISLPLRVPVHVVVVTWRSFFFHIFFNSSSILSFFNRSSYSRTAGTGTI